MMDDVIVMMEDVLSYDGECVMLWLELLVDFIANNQVKCL